MLYLNLFPRSGSAFLASLANKVLDTEISVIRDPEKYKEQINQIVVFRNPFETIASVVHRGRNESYLKDSNISWTNGIEEEIFYHNNEYIKFINLAIDNIENLFADTFENVMKDPVAFLKLAGEAYGLKALENPNVVEVAIEEMSQRHKTNDSKDYGHYIREKDQNRIDIENIVKNSDCMQESLDRYNIFKNKVAK